MIYRIEGNIGRGECTFVYDGFLSGHEGDILCMDFSGGDIIGTGSEDHNVKLWFGIRSEKRALHTVSLRIGNCSICTHA